MKDERFGKTESENKELAEVRKELAEERAAMELYGAEGKPEDLFVRPTEDIRRFLGEEGQHLPTTGVNIQLFFTDDSSKEPVITEMARELGIDFSICWAKLEEFRTDIYGSLVLNINEKDQDRVAAFLKEKGVSWEVLKA